MHARTAAPPREESNLPYRIRDVALDIGLLMIAATFTLLGGAGLGAHLLGVAYPLSGLMVADAALTGLLAGLCLLGWLFQAPRLRLAAALPLVAIALYTLAHNAWAGAPWQGSSWVTGGSRILSVAACLLLVALCSLIGMASRWRRLLWVAGGALALLAIDLDHFKGINDRHGHDVGDLVLQAFADLARRMLRDGDVLCRMGGEEFAVLLPDTTREQALQVAERLRQAIETTPVYLDAAADDALAYTASLGVTLVGGGEATLKPAIKRADQGLYAAKEAGRNRVEWQPG